MVLGIILGTRPEVIKMAPIIKYCIKGSILHYILHTGQHYSYEMDRAFFHDLELPEPNYNLDVGSGTHAEQTGRIMIGVEKVLQEEPTSIVFVQGDTNSVAAGTLAATKLTIPVGHVEAGLRSYDRTMPEEINRVIADHLSDHLFAPTEESRGNLLKEGISDDKIHVTGNTVVDAIYQNLQLAENTSNILKQLSIEPGAYIVVTAHRAENVDHKQRLQGILEGLKKVSQHFNQPVIYPIHPRTRKMIKQYNLDTGNLKTIEPLGYLDFLQLQSNARLILTDSGGIQEEACILKIPCVTLRNNTERPETLKVGSNTLAGTNPKKILAKAITMTEKKPNWVNPFGDGHSAERIMEAVIDIL